MTLRTFLRELFGRHDDARITDKNTYAPRLGRHLLHPRYWPMWLAMVVARLVVILPRRWRDRLGYWLGDQAYERSPKRREIIAVNLELCFPDLSETQRQTMARSFSRLMARTILDYGLLWWASESRLASLIKIEGEEHIRDSLSDGDSVILLTGHSIALDFGALALSRLYSSVGFVKPMRNPVLEWFASRGRTRFKAHLRDRASGIRGVIRDLRQGDIFYYLPDEDLGMTQQTEFVPFFGVPEATLTALGRIARMANAAVLPTMSYFEPDTGTYRVIVDPPLKDFPSGDNYQDALRQNQELERMIKRAPEQYMWSFRLFQTRPEGEENPYPYG